MPEDLQKSKLARYIIPIKQALTLYGWQVGCYLIGLIMMTLISNVCANSRCFNPVVIPFAVQNKAEVDNENNVMVQRQLKHIEWILKHEGKGDK
jgi:hypothetical protein